MEHNHELVTYFLEHFYTIEKHDLNHIMTPGFKFTVDGGGQMDFAGYTKRRDFMMKYVEFSFQLSDEDDDDHTCDIKFNIPRVGKPILYSSAKMKIQLLNNKIDRIDVVFNASGEDNATILNAIKEIKSLKDSINFL